MKQKIYNIIAKRIRPIELALLMKKVLFVKRRNLRIGTNTWFIDPISDFGFRMVNEGEYEPQMSSDILSNLEEGDVFVDLGGNEGYFSVLASAKVGNTGKVFCIEPQIRLWPVILNNIQINRLTNVSLFPYAISDEPGMIDIILSPDINTGASTMTSVTRYKFWKRQVINTSTLDSLFLDKNISIKVLKIDIEGFEFFALKGATKLLQKNQIKNIVIEMHPEQLRGLGHSIEQITNFLNSFGYKEKDGIFSCVN